MNTLKLNCENKPLMVAHRGCSGLERENTAAAFVAAGNRSYWGIETDVHVTADGQFVVIHDFETGRVPETNIPVDESTRAELSAIRLYSNPWQKTPGRSDLVIPDLSDYVRICHHYDKVAVLELKGYISEENVATIKEYSDRLTDRSARFHDPMQKTVGGVNYHILRHTPLEDTRVYMYSPLWADVESLVLPEIFNDEYLDLDTQYQPVTYWQSNTSDADRPKVDVEPAVVNTTTGVQEKGAEVKLDYVVGLITDRDGLMTDFQIDTTRTTPVEARKGYRNTWQIIAKNLICDPTEKTILFYMADPTT